MAIDADFSVLWNHLPQWFEVRQKITNIPKGWETCCIQMSYAFNRANLDIDYPNKARVLRFHGKEHMLDVKEMRLYIDETYEPAERIAHRDVKGAMINRWVLQSVIEGRRGVIAFGNRHIDLWNGSRIHGEHYIQSALWEADSALSQGLFFWEVSALQQYR
jgi:hypothetical protein